MSDPLRAFLDSMSRTEQRALACLILVAIVSIGVRHHRAEKASGYQLIGRYDPQTDAWVPVNASSSLAAPSATAPQPRPASPDGSMPAPGSAGALPVASTVMPSETEATSALLDINTATESQLMALPNIGAVRARSIVSWRRDHGAFHQVDDLLSVPGIGQKTLDGLRPYVSCGASGQSLADMNGSGPAPGLPHRQAPAGAIDLNTADLETLMLLPGIGETLGRRILDDRNRLGPYRLAEDLMRVHGIGQKTFEQIRPLIAPIP